MADDKKSLNAKIMPETAHTELRALQSGSLESQKPSNEISPVSQRQRTPAPGRMPLFRN